MSAPIQRKNLAATPPMGWNSFDSYGVYCYEEAALKNIEVLGSQLKAFGYNTFVLDNGWFGEYTLQPGTRFPNEKHASQIRIDDYGRVLPSITYFPNDFEKILERCRHYGLKFGLHLMRGIPRVAYAQNLPIEGTPYTARDIADTRPEANCTWCTYNYGVDMNHPGAQAWYDSLLRQLAYWGVEVIKYDDIVPYPLEVKAVTTSLNKIKNETGKEILLSLSPGGTVDPKALSIFQEAHMLRVTPDIWDNQKGIDQCFEAWKKWQGSERPGFWIDMDMIPFGQLQLQSPPPLDAQERATNSLLAGEGFTRYSHLNLAQKKTFMVLRALAASPLMIGGDLPTMAPEDLNLLIHPDILACNQNGVMGELVGAVGKIEIWKTRNAKKENIGWLGIFNRHTTQRELFKLSPEALGLKKSSTLKNLFTQLDLALETTQQVEANDVLFLSYEF